MPPNRVRTMLCMSSLAEIIMETMNLDQKQPDREGQKVALYVLQARSPFFKISAMTARDSIN